MLKLLLCLVMLYNNAANKLDEISWRYSDKSVLVEISIMEASRLFKVDEKDIRSIIKMESGNKINVTGNSGEFGLMQITHDEFVHSAPRLNVKLFTYGLPPIMWKTKGERLHPRNNVLIGVYNFSKYIKSYKSSIWAAMAHNVGRFGVAKTKREMTNRRSNPYWYCFKVNKTIRTGRQFSYTYKFAKLSGRIKEWKNLFGDIPEEAVAAFNNGTGHLYCSEKMRIAKLK